MKLKNIIVVALAFAGVVAGAAGGTTVVGDEAREVFDTLISAGATRTEIPEGPTVIIDDLKCTGQMTNGQLMNAQCQLMGDPKLNHLEGNMGLRLLKGLIAMGVRQKSAEGNQVMVALTGLDCGVLHYQAHLHEGQKGQASCYFVDSN